MVTFSMTFTDH